MSEHETIADSLDGIPHPAQSKFLLGHEAAQSHLLKQYKSGRMHHAWLLTGPRGIGKATLAMHMAAHVFRNPDGKLADIKFATPERHEPNYAKIVAGSHPNLLHLTRPWDQKTKKSKTKLTVDEIRQTVSFFGTSRGEAGWRVTIVDPADDMNAAASNALLKILEEPPDQTLFFIISHSPAKVLPTIRSRCQQLTMNGLENEHIEQILERFGVTNGLSSEDQKLLVTLSNGSARRAIVLAQGNGLELYKKFADVCKTLPTPNWSMVQNLADGVTLRGREDKYRLLLQFANEYIEDKATGKEAMQKPVSVLARWAEVWEKSRNGAMLAESYNLDKKQVILNLFQEMSEAARS